MIYLDNSATTPLSDAAKRAITEAMEVYGNPSSVHTLGLDAAKRLEAARGDVRAALSLPPQRPAGGDRLFFCGSGTEANNLALRGVAFAKARNRGMEIITTESEHPSVLATLESLEAEGFVIKKLPTVGGVVSLSDLQAAVTPRTLLLSVMCVNNETGAIYPVRELFAAAKRLSPRIFTHTDCVQAFGKIPCSPTAFGADLLTVSAHKIGGPKGVGALYVSERILRGRDISPIIFGGGQEDGLRSGTENLLGMIGFGAAARELPTHLGTMPEVAALRDHIVANLPADVRANLPAKAAPHILNITLPHIKSETMLHFLSGEGICVSAGSACASHGKGGSYVLRAFGLSERDADTSIRISLSHLTTRSEVDTFLQSLQKGVETLVRITN